MENQNSKTILAIMIILLVIIILVGTWITLNTTNLLMIKPKAEIKNYAYGRITINIEEQKNRGTGEVSIGILPRPE